MNEYEAKQEARRARYAARAKDARAEGARRAEMATQGLAPMGEPIKIGHHSEKRHRRAIETSDVNMRRAADAYDKARHYENRAESVGHGGISADDPDAFVKLRRKLVELQVAVSNMKGWNAQFRRAKGDLADKIAAMSAPETVKSDLLALMTRCPHIRQPFTTTTNTAAEIRRLVKRIANTEAIESREEGEPVLGDGWTLKEDIAARRIRFVFDGKPAPETRTLLKRHGFKWAPSVGGWQRQLNNNGTYAARMVRKVLENTP